MANGHAGAQPASGDEMKTVTRGKIDYDENSASPGAPNWRHGQIPSPMNATTFCRTPFGRALLHAACLCRHPGAARFFLMGLTRNLREWQHHRAHRRLCSR
jgi:hypothetical protein